VYNYINKTNKESKMIKKMTKTYQKEIVDYLYTIIDINRVGSDEIDAIESILSDFESLTLKNITIEKLNTVKKEVIDITKWCDRLGSDELFIINRIVKIVDYLVS